jgi:hypothetical protein
METIQDPSLRSGSWQPQDAGCRTTSRCCEFTEQPHVLLLVTTTLRVVLWNPGAPIVNW